MENKEIRFIDSHYNELFRIKDGESITVNRFDGVTNDYVCKHLDSYHTEISGHCYHICEFAEFMERNGNTYRPKDTPSYALESITQEEFDYMFAPEDETKNRGCICYIRGYFDNSIDENFKAVCMIENSDNYKKYKTQDFSRECDNIINYFRFQSDKPILKSKAKMSYIANVSKAERFTNDKEICGYRVTTKDNTYYLKCDARQGQYCLYMYCYDNAALQKYKDLQFVEQNYGEIDRDKFFKTDSGVTEIYYNPDSNAGGQLVELTIYKEDIVEAAKLHKNPQDFFSHLEGMAKGTLHDIGTKGFMDTAKHFMKAKADFEGCTPKTMKALKKYAGIEPKKEKSDKDFFER